MAERNQSLRDPEWQAKYGAVFDDVVQARIDAAEKHGPMSMEHIGWRSRRWLPILVEEVGEVAHELTYDAGHIDQRTGYAEPEALYDELIQVAAVACAWAAAVQRGVESDRANDE